MSHHHHDHDHYDGQAPIDHTHDHDDDITPALQNQLYSQIDFSAVQCLNESTAGSAIKVLQKTYDQRLEPDPEIESDCDEQLLLTIPFIGQIRLHAIIIRTSNSLSAPLTLHLHKNKPSLDFSEAESSPVQTLSLSQSNDVQEVPVKRSLFNNLSTLTLFFADNWGQGDEDVTKITYIAFKGEWMKLSKEPVVVMYEAAANPKDHKLKGVADMGVGSGIGY